MNRIYRLVWSHTFNAFVVTSELGCARGKRGAARDARDGVVAPLLLTLGLLGCIGTARAGDPRLQELLGVAERYAPSRPVATEPGADPLPGAARVQLAAAPAYPPRSTTPPSSSVVAPPRPATLAASLDTAVRATPAQVDARVRAQVAGVRAAAALGLAVDARELSQTAQVLAPVASAVHPVVDTLARTGTVVAPRTTARAKQAALPLARGLGRGVQQLANGEAGEALASLARSTSQATHGAVEGVPALAQAIIDDKRRALQGTGQVATAIGDRLLPGRENLLGPVKDVVATTVGLVEGGPHALPASLGEVVIGATDFVQAGVRGTGDKLGAAVTGLTGSAALGGTVDGVSQQLGGGVGQIGTHLVAGDVPAVVARANQATQGVVTDVAGGVDALLAGTTGGSGGLAPVASQVNGVLVQVGDAVDGLLHGQSGSTQPLPQAVAGAVADVVDTAGATTTQLLSQAPQQTVPVALDGVGRTVAHLGDTLGGAVPGNHALTASVGQALADAGSGVQSSAQQLAAGDASSALHGVGSTVGSVVEDVAAGLGMPGADSGGVLGGVASQVGGLLSGIGGDADGNPVTGLLGGVSDTLGSVVGGTVGGVVNGITGELQPALSQAGQSLGQVVGGVTGSDTLAGTVSNATSTLGSGLAQVGSSVQQGDLVGAVDQLGNTVGSTGAGAVTGVADTLGGLTGSTSGTSGLGGLLGGVVNGVGDGLGTVVGGLTGVAPAAAPAVPAQTGSPGLVIGTGGLTGSLGQLLDSTTTGLFGGDGYVRNGDLAVNSANFQQGYAVTNVLGVPVVNTTPVGTLLDAVGGAATGGNSHLTLIGGVTSDSYIYNINNGNPGGVLGLLLPENSPEWAAQCANLLGLASTDCWAVNAAQDYQVLIGDGAFANGSKEVVIGTNARHQLAAQDASVAFPGAGTNDPDNPTGVPTADYDARLGHSVVIGDDANGSANAQTLIGAGATSNKANTVALGYQSNAARGGQDNYMAYGLTSAQNSIGEVAVGSTGRERQITHVAAGSEATDAVNVAQLEGAIDQINQVDIFAVTYDTDASGNPDYSRVTLGTVGSATTTVIGNLAAGEVSLDSTEAINGAQLYALGQGTSLHLGGGSTVDANGVPTAPTYVINNIGSDGSITIGTYDNVGSALDALSTSLGNIDIDAPDALAVHYDADASGNASNQVTLRGDGSGAAVGIGNVADGVVALGSRDAVTGGQLFDTNSELAAFLGGTTAYDGATGTWTGPQFAISSFSATGEVTTTAYGDATSAFAAVDGSLQNLNNRVRNISTNASPYLAVNTTGGPAAADGAEAVALGPDASAAGDASLALGSGASAVAANSVALGSGSVATRANSVSVGAVGAERQVVNVAAGAVAQGSTDAINGGQLFQANSQVANYFGGTTRYDGSTGTWTGPTFQITSVSPTGGTTRNNYGNVSSAFEAVDGSLVNINQRIDNIQDGAGNAYFSVQSTRGPAAASGAESVAIGPQASATAANSVALGADSIADRANSVSVGSAGAERQVVNVADGTAATDAVNLRQLEASQQGTVRYDTRDGRSVYSSLTLGQGGTTTQVHNVAAGEADTDAVNVGQLKSGMADAMDWSKNYTDSRINRVDNQASAGVASAMAMAGLPQPYEAGRSMASFAASTYNGESGFAVGIAGVTEGGRWIYKVSGSANSRGDSGVSVGAGIQW